MERETSGTLDGGPRPFEDRLEIPARGQRAEREAVVAGEARRDEHVGDRRLTRADQQRAFERQGETLDDTAGRRLDLLPPAELVPDRVHERIETAVVASGESELVEERLHALALAC